MPRSYLWQAAGWLATPKLPDELIKKAEENTTRELKLRNMPEVHETDHVLAEAFLAEVISNFAVEGIALDSAAVRSSVIKESGLNIPEWDSNTSMRFEDEQNAVKATIQSLRSFHSPMSSDLLCSINRRLSPADASMENGLPLIHDTPNYWGNFRVTDIGVTEAGSGAFLFEGPSPQVVPGLVEVFASWWNAEKSTLPPMIFGALAHLFLVEIHPFGDGNGRTARILAETALVRDTFELFRPYSVSAAVYRNRTFYYRTLEKIHTENDIPLFVHFMLDMQKEAVEHSITFLLKKRELANFWQQHDKNDFTLLQQSLLKNMILDMTDKPWDASRLERMRIPGAFSAFEDLVHKGLIRAGRLVGKEGTISEQKQKKPGRNHGR